MSARALPTSIVEGSCGDPAVWEKGLAQARRELADALSPRLAEITIGLVAELRQALYLNIAWPSGLSPDLRTTIEAQISSALEGELVRYHVRTTPIVINAVGALGRELCDQLRIAAARV